MTTIPVKRGKGMFFNLYGRVDHGPRSSKEERGVMALTLDAFYAEQTGRSSNN